MSLPLVLAGCCFSGCGGGNVGLSGPNPQTLAGFGTLMVSVQGEGVGLVSFQEQVQRTSGGKAYFYNIRPGRYPVRASLELHGTLLGAVERDVDIIADKTVRLTLRPIDPSPFATSTPFPLEKPGAFP